MMEGDNHENKVLWAGVFGGVSSRYLWARWTGQARREQEDKRKFLDPQITNSIPRPPPKHSHRSQEKQTYTALIAMCSNNHTYKTGQH